MRLRSLTLEQFRNYPSLKVSFDDNPVQLFLGENGMGKTNLLEAIGILSLTKSCRGADEEDLTQWDQGHYRVRGEVEADDGTVKTLEVVCERSPRKRKAAFINDVRTALTDIVGIFPTVTFLPEDLSLFRGAPAERRRFIDQVLCQVSPEYLQDLLRYQRLLKQRNALLKNITAGRSDKKELLLWDEPLSECGARIVVRRLELLEVFNATLAFELQTLGLPWDDAKIVAVRSGKERIEEAISRELLSLLIQHRDRDCILQSTTVGPHRDDWSIETEGRALPTFASRGQERIALLAILFLEVSYLQLQRNERPVVLFDDVFSELDEQHQALLLTSLGASQVFLTSTHLPPKSSAHVWHVAGGSVHEAVLKRDG